MNICPLNSRALDTRIKPSLSWSLSGFRDPAATDKVCPQHRGSPFLLTCHRHFVPKGNWPSGCPVHRVSEVKEVTDNKKRSQASCVQMLAPAGSRVVQVSAVHQGLKSARYTAQSGDAGDQTGMASQSSGGSQSSGLLSFTRTQAEPPWPGSPARALPSPACVALTFPRKESMPVNRTSPASRPRGHRKGTSTSQPCCPSGVRP